MLHVLSVHSERVHSSRGLLRSPCGFPRPVLRERKHQRDLSGGGATVKYVILYTAVTVLCCSFVLSRASLCGIYVGERQESWLLLTEVALLAI